MKVQVGDTVHVRGTVQKVDTDDTVRVLFAKMENAAWVGNSDIVRAEPRPIEVGDKVRMEGCGSGTVVARSDDSFWVRRGHGYHETWTLPFITRIESDTDATR